jgi:type I restriction enzyme S subunit
MSEWREAELNDVCYKITDGSHQSPKDCIGGFPMFSVKDMESYGFNYSKVKTISEDDFNFLVKQGCKPNINDILIAKDGSVLKHIFRVRDEPNYVLLSSIAILRPKTEIINPDYLVYTIKSPVVNDLILSNFVSGSGVPRIVLKDFKKVQISFPPLPEQERIAEVLSSLDDKIDLLHRNNKTLEQLAETLFRQWFVDETEDSKLSDEFNVTMGQSPPGDTYNETGNGIIFYQGRTDFGFRFPKPRVYCTHPTRFAESLDTLMSVRAPVGDINYAAEKCCIGRGVAAIRHKNKDIHHSYTYYLMKHLRSDFDVHEDTGTIFGSINKDELLSIKCPKLDINNISYFNSSIGSLDDKLVSNCKQIQQLETLRDTLLPKLMSGVVRVEN